MDGDPPDPDDRRSNPSDGFSEGSEVWDGGAGVGGFDSYPSEPGGPVDVFRDDTVQSEVFDPYLSEADRSDVQTPQRSLRPATASSSGTRSRTPTPQYGREPLDSSPELYSPQQADRSPSTDDDRPITATGDPRISSEAPSVVVTTPNVSRKAGKRRIPKGADASNYFNRICRVKGCVFQARGLSRQEKAKSRLCSYVMVKGIRSNLFLENIAMSDVVEGTSAPAFNLSFDFEVPDDWGTIELLGLKFLAFHTETGVDGASILGTDDFLGGVDLDVSDAKPSRLVQHELELGGLETKKTRSGMMEKRRRAQLMVELTVFREFMLRPDPLSLQLQASMDTYPRVEHLYVRLHSCKYLADVCTASDPIVHIRVRAVLVDGETETLFETGSKAPSEANWDLVQRLCFARDRQPMALHFDVFEKEKTKTDRFGHRPDIHLGTAVYELCGLDENSAKVQLKLKDVLVEKRLDIKGRVPTVRTGHSRRVSGTETAQSKRTLGAGIGAGISALAGKMRRALQQPRTPLILVVLAVKTMPEPMPHRKLLETPFMVRNEDDAEAAHEDWLASHSCFTPPAMLEHRVVKVPHLIEASGHIIFVCGVVRGAAELIAADVMGKSDPYCLVQAFAKNKDEPLFVHRTRIIKDTLCPFWDEHFHAVIPEDFDLYMLLFTVYDSDERSYLSLLADAEDDFLGRAAVDVSYLKNGQKLYGEASLVGARKTVSTSCFRRTSRVDVEVSVERRVLPVLRLQSDETLKDPQRHTLSRLPPSQKLYQNPSQEIIYQCKIRTNDLYMYYKSGGLLEIARQRARNAGGVDIEALMSRPIKEPKIWIHPNKVQSVAEDADADEEEREPEPFTQEERLASTTFNLEATSRRWAPEAETKTLTTQLSVLDLRRQEQASRCASSPSLAALVSPPPPHRQLRRNASLPDSAMNYSVPPMYSRFGPSLLSRNTFCPGGLLEQARGLAPIAKAVTSSTFREDRMRISEGRVFRQFSSRPAPASLSTTL
eukprot:TRINITY_DN18260_c0_g1_i1.p1 TRINITY_DN18260_c0_g1~~TRINITY_DN18260_c0_g1_i1.p1  ORF type:complete len:999 (+),score=203.62 TRINITY_DN18260_c0_g1_i1:229-3225(+)